VEDLESFKEARLKMDPTARKMSADQWKRAFDAHLRAKERVHGGRRDSQESAGSSKEGRGRSNRASRHGFSGHRGADPSAVRQRVREESAYSDLRLIVDILAWLAIAVVILTALVPLFFNTPIPVSLVALLNAMIGVISVIVARLLIQVLIDVPDIALYRMAAAPIPEKGPVDPPNADAGRSEVDS
jgi:hypothetical protein